MIVKMGIEAVGEAKWMTKKKNNMNVRILAFQIGFIKLIN